MDDDELQPTESWEDCYERLAPKLVLFARQWLPQQHDAEDAVQDAFVRVWKRAEEDGRYQDAYFYAATRTAALDFIRGNTRRAQRENEVCAGPLFETVDTPPALSPQDVDAALGTLPAEQREAVVLRIWGGLSFGEIGAITGAAAETATSRYRYAVAALKKFFNVAAS
ncbi:sigma-70 family RNA polymerase sigma factor [Verrucomicrobia bacterium LW23]|nr:sigma-70 family RNA polymerase sigma factor [Verrucomicrobia bacterium LW23]